ncbi:MAG: CTP synthase [Patescibacteria group bacterium]
MHPRYIFITGGVISGLGKGITSASLGRILKSKGYRVTNIKCEMYVNVDAGTIRPTEHGEIFVTDDGVECDQDIGTYERFLDQNIYKECFLTTGQIYRSVIERERNFKYEGEDVEVVPHVPQEIIRRIKLATKKTKAEIAIIELGGTVGEYQGVLFLEAARMMEFESPSDVIHIHVSYLPIPKNIGEMKTKPVQYSVRTLNAAGIQPDFIIGRAEREMDQKRKEKIAYSCNVKIENVISNPDVPSIYEVPLILERQKLGEKILKTFDLKSRSYDMRDWKKLVKKIKSVKKEVKIGIVGKYFKTGDFSLEDSYISVIEAIKHAAFAHNLKPKNFWIDSAKYENDKNKARELKEFDGIIVPGGYGSRGTEGKIAAIKFVREHKIPYLGLCLGMQLACIEFSRNVLKLKDAATTEINPKTKHPVICVMEYQKKLLAKKQYGATNRLGAYLCRLKKSSRTFFAYKKAMISERHRHRYEFNNKYIKAFEAKGMIFSGINPQMNLIEIIELQNHPFFLATQFHPEFKSRPLSPHPLFLNFIAAAKNH